MRFGPRERVTLRGVRVTRGPRQARARTEGFRPSSPARPRHEAHERVRGGDALLRHAPSLERSRPARFEPLHGGGEGLAPRCSISQESEPGTCQSASPPPGRPAAAKQASCPANQAPRERGGRASAGGDRQLTSLCSRVVRVAEVGRPYSGSEKRASACAGGETSRVCVGPAWTGA
jgi:hypothetical protein